MNTTLLIFLIWYILGAIFSIWVTKLNHHKVTIGDLIFSLTIGWTNGPILFIFLMSMVIDEFVKRFY